MDTQIVNDMANVTHLNALNANAVMLGDNLAVKPWESITRKRGNSDHARWSTNDNYPADVLEKVRLHPFIARVINRKVEIMSSGVLQYGYYEGYDADGEEIFVRFDHPRIKRFMQLNNLLSYKIDAFRDLYMWNNCWPSFTKNAELKEIIEISCFDAATCRFKNQNKKTGLKDAVYIDFDFPKWTEETRREIPLIDTYWRNYEDLRNAKDKQLAYFLTMSQNLNKYYQDCDWHNIFTSDIFDWSTAIPKFKLSWMNNQMSPKFVVHVPDSWWEWKYPGFNDKAKYSLAKRKEFMTKEFNNFNTMLTGVEKVGKTLVATYKTDDANKVFAKWEIVPIENKNLSGEFIEDSQEVNSIVLTAMGMDNTLMSTPGKGIAAGSGSDKRVARNNFIIDNEIFAQRVCEPLDVTSVFNNWTGPAGQPVVWRLKYRMVETSNNITPDKRP